MKTRVGDKLGRDTFIGITIHENKCYSIFLAPASYRVTLPFCTRITANHIPKTSYSNGFLNTYELLTDPGFDAAAYCRNLVIDGKTGWYLPSIGELDLCYSACKPTSQSLAYNNIGSNYLVPPVKTGQYIAEPVERSIVVPFRYGSKEYVKNEMCGSSTVPNPAQYKHLIKGFALGLVSQNLLSAKFFVLPIRRELVS